MTTAIATEQERIAEYQQIWSCHHKEAYGFRPRGPMPEWTLAEWEAEFDRLGRICDENAKQEAERQAIAVAEFEETIQNAIAVGAADRETALRWLRDAHDTHGDDGYLEYQLGLPYGYLSRGTP